MNTRRIIGITGIIIGLIGWFALEQETSPGIYNYLVSVNVLIVLVYTWLLLSLGTKIAMIFKKRWWILPFSSCVLLAIIFVVASMFVDQIVPFETHIVYKVLVGLWVFGWIFIDVSDAFNVFVPYS